MVVELYDPAYERSYQNNIGPGPQAYSKMYDIRETDRFRKTAFPHQRRLLTSGKQGPGPTEYESHVAKDKVGCKEHPRPKFNLANRKIDVLRWRQASKESLTTKKRVKPY